MSCLDNHNDRCRDSKQKFFRLQFLHSMGRRILSAWCILVFVGGLYSAYRWTHTNSAFQQIPRLKREPYSGYSSIDHWYRHLCGILLGLTPTDDQFFHGPQNILYPHADAALYPSGSLCSRDAGHACPDDHEAVFIVVSYGTRFKAGKSSYRRITLKELSKGCS